MIAPSPHTTLSNEEEDSKPVLSTEGPSKASLIDFEKKLREVEQKKKAEPSATTTVPGKNALLARVQAAQQRARMAQEKQKQAELEMQKANAEEDGLLIELDTTEKDFSKQAISKDPPPLVHELDAFLQPPIADKGTISPPQAPSAPPVAEEMPGFSTVSPVPPPLDIQQEPPPPYEQFEASAPSDSNVDAAFNLDAIGNEMSPEQRSEMILEQEKIMQQIKEEQEANQAAIAAAIAGNTPQEYGASDHYDTSIMTKEEAEQMSLDRKMAEQIQNEEWKKEAKLAAASKKSRSQENQSWSEYFSSLIPASTNADEDEASKPRSAEIVVGRKSHPLQRSEKPAAVNIYGDDSEEIDFQHNGNESSSLLQPGLVAENKPMFSCVVESVSNILSGQNEVPNGKLHGVDTSSLLSVTSVGRKSDKDDGRGEYQNLNF